MNKFELQKTVDQLGEIKAQISELTAIERDLKHALIAAGEPEIEGSLFRATVNEAVRWTINTKGLREEFGEDWVTARSKQSVVTTVRVAARKRAAA
jgi:hypothetical protein